MIEKYLKDNNLIIVPNSYRKKVIREINGLSHLISYKVMSLEEFLENYFFSYNKETIYYVMKRLEVSYEIALEYIKHLYYVEDIKYPYLKLNELVSLKKELFDNNLLITNPLFLEYLKNTNIIVYGYVLDPYYLKILNKYTSVDISLPNKKHTVYSFNNINEEVSYVISSIKEKIDNGIDINNIKLINSGSEYMLPLNRLFKWANVPIEDNIKISLYDLEVGKQIIKYLEEDLSFEEIINKLEVEEDILNKIIALFNEYNVFSIPKEYLIEMIKYELNNSYLSRKKYNNTIKLCSLEEVNDNDIVYLIGFNKENYPKINKDEDFLSDTLKKELGIFTSSELNENNRNKVINLLNRDINYIITYKEKDYFNEYNPSLLINELDMEVIDNNKINYNYSDFSNRIKLGIELDNYNKYGITSHLLEDLASTYDVNRYNTYNNIFTGIDNKYFLSSLKKLNLSYTKIDNYFRCMFSYYISYILELKKEDSDSELSKDIGNIFHYVLEHYKEKTFDFDRLWNEKIKEYQLTIGEKEILNNLKDELKFSIDIIRRQETYSSLEKYYTEKEIPIKINNPKLSNVVFSGKVDKIYYKDESNKTIVSVVDYKTGELPQNFNNISDGIGMQLPIYLYLIRKGKLFNNSIFAGFYLQKIINKDKLYKYGKDMTKEKEDCLKLFGYSNKDFDIISKFDNNYVKSNCIRSLSVTQQGEYNHNSKVMDDVHMDKLVEFVDDKINEASNNILDGNFKINPKRMKDDELSCRYCKFNDICYKKEKDYTDLKTTHEYDFLGGEEDA